MTPKTINIHGKNYTPVSERVRMAHEGEKLQGVKTEVLLHTPIVVIQATVNISGVEYQGISSANPEKSIEKANPYEVAETSAIGRALGFAGYGIEEGIASADEMAKAGFKEGTAVSEPTRYDNREEKPVGKYEAQKTHHCEAHQRDLKFRETSGGNIWDHRQLINEVWNTCYGNGKWHNQEARIPEKDINDDVEAQ